MHICIVIKGAGHFAVTYSRIKNKIIYKKRVTSQAISH